MNPAEFRHLCSQFATGVTIVTALDRDGLPRGMTASAFASVSLDPPLISVAVETIATIHPVMLAGQHFTVNILDERQEELSIRFASGLDDRFGGVNWTQVDGDFVVIGGALANLRCEKWTEVPAGDHTIFVGRVIGGETSGQGRALIHYRGGYVTPDTR